MNKKFLVVALMAALSTVGYAVTADDLNDKLFAEGTGVIGNLENKDTELQNQHLLFHLIYLLMQMNLHLLLLLNI